MAQGLKSKKGTWNQAILAFLTPIFLVLVLRWAFIEPFVIPSGSMIPNLLIHDNILVQKLSFGLKVPFSEKWILQWARPQRGDVVVFRYPENKDVFYIKRLIGLPGDRLEIDSGRVKLNGQDWGLVPQYDMKSDEFYYFIEQNGQRDYVVRFLTETAHGRKVSIEVPPDQYFFMGDNRDQSSDSRAWGFVQNDLLVGRAWTVWLSCNNTLPNMTFVCDPAQLRWERIFKKVH